jgi:hypothetical protein
VMAVLGAAMVVAQVAQAQMWIGLMVGDMMARGQAAETERLCMIGTPMPDAEIEEARKPSLLALQGYWQTVSNARPANVSAHFNLTSKTRWVNGAMVLPMAGLAAVSDPFAASKLVFDEAPMAFVRAGDGASAAAQWAVRDRAGKRSGTYQARFTRAAGVWRLSELELVGAATYVDPLVQYCHKRDDVLPYRLSSAEWLKTHTAKRAAKAGEKAAIARTAAAKAEAAAAAATGSGKAAKATAAALAAAKSQKAEEAAALRKSEADKAVSADTQAKADAAALTAVRTAGIAALTAQ